MSPQYWQRRRWLYQSAQSAVANSTSSTLRQGLHGLISSVLQSPLIVSAKALSQHDPTAPTEAAIPVSVNRSDKVIDAYCTPRSQWCTRPAATIRRSTVQHATGIPSRFNCSHTLRAP
mgnify:FL=1